MRQNRNPIRLARDAAGITQIEAALQAGVSLSTYRLAEHGVITRRTLERIAVALGVSVADLASALPEEVARAG